MLFVAGLTFVWFLQTRFASPLRDFRSIGRRPAPFGGASTFLPSLVPTLFKDTRISSESPMEESPEYLENALAKLNEYKQKLGRVEAAAAAIARALEQHGYASIEEFLAEQEMLQTRLSTLLKKPSGKKRGRPPKQTVVATDTAKTEPAPAPAKVATPKPAAAIAEPVAAKPIPVAKPKPVAAPAAPKPQTPKPEPVKPPKPVAAPVEAPVAKVEKPTPVAAPVEAPKAASVKAPETKEAPKPPPVSPAADVSYKRSIEDLGAKEREALETMLISNISPTEIAAKFKIGSVSSLFQLKYELREKGLI